MTRREQPGAVELYQETGSFDQSAQAATIAVARSPNTLRAYASDLRHWKAFCTTRGFDYRGPDPKHDPSRAELEALEVAVSAWVAQMRKDGLAPKTRARRIASLCSIYRRLKRKGVVAINPFSLEEGPEREIALALEPTPVSTPEDVKKLLATCDESTLGIRDTAIIRILWGTGARRASLVAMTFERLRADRGGGDYIARLIAKGNKEVPVLIRGHAATALTRWVTLLREAKLSSGPIWRTKRGPMSERAVGHMLQRRAKRAGVTGSISPHTFRVAFLTYNPAGLEAKQEAAGHADPATTRLYDRASWRGREAFEVMPEIEDTK